MNDEKIIYVSPKDDLTSVRERLEQVEERHIILIVQPPTQLKSHVGWRVIHSRMRERNKDVLVICTDRQIRAVAKAAGFRVAESQAAPISNRTRPASRPGLNPGSKAPVRSRPPTRGAPEGRPTRQREQPPGRRRFSPSERPIPQVDGAEDSSLERTDKDESILGASRDVRPSPSVFSTPPDEAFGHPIDFNIEASPSVQPAVPHHEEEEFSDPLKAYYDQAQLIRKNAQEGQREAMTAPPEPERQTFGGTEARDSQFGEDVEGAEDVDADPYAFMDDQPFISLPEQRASAPGFVDEADAVAPDISDIPTDQVENPLISMGEIEDLGDTEAEDLPEFSLSQPDEPARSEPLSQRPPGSRTRSQRSGSLSRRPTPEPGRENEYADPPTLIMPPSQVRQPRQTNQPPYARQPRPSGELRDAPAANRPPQPILQGQSRSASTRTPPGPSSQRPRGARSIMPPPSSPTRRPGSTPPASAPARRSNRGVLITIGCLVLLALIAIGLFYFAPTATVTISLPAKAYTLPVQLNATTSQHSTLTNPVHAQTLSFTSSASGQENATGTTRVGNAPARGVVTFTNNGSKPIIIPSNTLISTHSGIQFLTDAEALVPGQNTFPVTIVAQQAGDNGKVPPGSITVIPSDSITKIAQASQIPTTAVNLTVTNANGTQGGGATTVPAVAQKDLAGLTQSLHAKLQEQVKTWLAQQMHTGDIRGKVIPDVLGSAKPLPAEQLVGAPAVGNAATSGTFSGSLSLHISVLVVRAADLQKAASNQLDISAQKLKPAFMLVSEAPITLSNPHTTPSNDGSSLAIALNATGQIIPLVSANTISNTSSGKTISQAETDITNAMTRITTAAGLQGKPSVTITVWPSFLSLTPLRSDRITVNFKPLQQPSPHGVPNG